MKKRHPDKPIGMTLLCVIFWNLPSWVTAFFESYINCEKVLPIPAINRLNQLRPVECGCFLAAGLAIVAAAVPFWVVALGKPVLLKVVVVIG